MCHTSVEHCQQTQLCQPPTSQLLLRQHRATTRPRAFRYELQPQPSQSLHGQPVLRVQWVTQGQQLPLRSMQRLPEESEWQFALAIDVQLVLRVPYHCQLTSDSLHCVTTLKLAERNL